jgi:ketosteroid isomerase-like protein
VIPPEFEFTTSAAVASEPGTYRGHDGARRYFDEFYEAMDEIRVEPHRFHDLGDKVAVDFTLRARGRTTEIETSIDAVQLWDVTGGIVRKATIYRTLEEARAAA